MDNSQDAYGRYLLARLRNEVEIGEIVERDDDFIDTGSLHGYYFSDYKDWSKLEQTAIDFARGKVLDIGAGAGRHALYLQSKNCDVTAIDNSPGAIEVCKQRGVQNAIVCSIQEIERFAPQSFDTIIMMGNNFGLFGSPENARAILAQMHRITTENAHIIAGTLNPYKTDAPEHLEYHELNRSRNRMPGQLRLRIRFHKTIGAWFDYLFVSPDEMQQILTHTDWQIRELVESEAANYFVVLIKK